MEIWKTIEMAPEFQISNRGRVRSKSRAVKGKCGRIFHYKGKLRHIFKRKDGYFHLRLKRANGVYLPVLVHRLVAIAFIPNPLKKKEVNHKDNDHSNNHVHNLEWATTKENIRHAHANGFVNSARGSRHGCAKMTEELVVKIRKLSKEGMPGLQIEKWLKQNLNISISAVAIRLAIRRKTWRHV